MNQGKNVVRVEVVLDDNVPEYMMGIIRCGNVCAYDENDELIKDHQEIIDNTEYHSECELIDDVAKRLGVDPSIIKIVELLP